MRDLIYHLDVNLTAFKLYRLTRFLVRSPIEYLTSFLFSGSALFKAVKNLKSSDTLVIVGNGPSLNQMDLTFLHKFDTLTVNAFHTKAQNLDLVPTFHMIEDNLPAFENRNAIKDFKCGALLIPRSFGWMYKDTISPVFQFNFIRSALKYRFLGRFQFSKFFDKRCYWGGTVLFAALQLGYRLQYNRVILIGVDLTYVVPDDAIIKGNIIQTVGADPNHFDGKYFGYGKKWHVPEVDKMQKAFDAALAEYETRGLQLLNGGVGGNLKNINRIDYRSL